MSSAELSYTNIRPFEWHVPRKWLQAFWSTDIAVDLGTANTLVYVRKHGIVLNEPSIIAVDIESNKPIAIGHEAKKMFGRTSRSVRCVRPMKDGVIADFEMTSLMISHMLRRTFNPWSLQKPRAVIGVPSGVTQVEKRAVIDAALRAGIREVRLVEEPLAAALGAGLPIDRALGNMVVDIGGGTTEVAVLSMNGAAYSHSIRVAGDEMDEAIQRRIRRAFGIQIGIFEAERIKLILGSALPLGRSRALTVFGRDVSNGIPRQVDINDELVRQALDEPLSAIIASVSTALEQISPEVAQDVVARGVYLSGGGALLKGLCERLSRETGVRFYRVQDPLSCVVRGVGLIVDNLKQMKSVCIA